MHTLNIMCRLGILLLIASALHAGPLDGAWQGTLEAGQRKLHLQFHFKSNDKGEWSGTLDSLDQGANGIPLSAVRLNGNTVVVELAAIGGKYEGMLSPDGKRSGARGRQGQPIPLVLQRSTEKQVAKLRPQEPVKPYPYREEEVSYPNPKAADVRLAGTLTLPREGKGPYPAVLLITGSGPQDRDEAIMGHKPFLVLADYLTRRGIAVLRVDDRGTAKSTGSFSGATTADFATDAEAGISFLKARPDIDKSKIGLLGHSEGGIIAPMIAARSTGVAFIVMMAGLGVGGESMLLAQGAGLAGPKTVEFQKKAFAVLKTEKDAEAARSRLTALLDEMAGPNAMPEAMKRQTLDMILSGWFRGLLAYDPAPVLRKVKCPVLAINGEKDVQVDARTNLPGIRSALAAGGNRDVTIVQFPNLNHLFQTAETGNVSEYGNIEETISPVVLQTIADWIRKKTGLT
jgi:X-Pro dipeptidyl-peptidase (S15 family).